MNLYKFANKKIESKIVRKIVSKNIGLLDHLSDDGILSEKLKIEMSVYSLEKWFDLELFKLELSKFK